MFVGESGEVCGNCAEFDGLIVLVLEFSSHVRRREVPRSKSRLQEGHHLADEGPFIRRPLRAFEWDVHDFKHVDRLHQFLAGYLSFQCQRILGAFLVFQFDLDLLSQRDGRLTVRALNPLFV